MNKRDICKMGRRGFVGGLLASVALPAAAQGLERSLRPQLRKPGLGQARTPAAEAIVSAAGLSGNVRFAVADAASGKVLEGREAKQGAVPASVAKAVTALYALDVLGPDHRFETRILATGGITDGIIQGDLVLAGGGDPTLTTDGLATLAANLKAAGVRGVKGGFVVYDGALPRLWSIDRDQPDHVGYSPALGGIALNFNRVHFEWKKSGGSFAVTMDARTAKYRPDVAMARMRIEDRKSPIYTYKDAGRRDDWTVAKGALGQGGARWLPVRKPALYAADVFSTLARSQGIVLKPVEVRHQLPQGTIVARHQSGPLRGILQAMLKYSTNVTAEMVGMSASAKRLGHVRSLRASAQEMNVWAEAALGMERPAFVDHSGLGEDSRLSPSDMVQALVTAHRDKRLRPILKPIRMRDAKGRPVREHPLKVDAKTGTLNFVSCLAGYLTTPKGRVLAFAMFTADEAVRRKITRAERERPPGGRAWNRRSRALQQDLLERWGQVYAA